MGYGDNLTVQTTGANKTLNQHERISQAEQQNPAGADGKTAVNTQDSYAAGNKTANAATVAQENEALKQRNAELSRENQKLKELNELEEKKAVEGEGFFGILQEIFTIAGEFAEAFLRCFSNIANLFSAIVRAVNLAYAYATDRDINAEEQWLRLGGDIAGIFFPPAGMLVDKYADRKYKHDEMLGGINDLGANISEDLLHVGKKGWEMISGPEESQSGIRHQPVTADVMV